MTLLTAPLQTLVPVKEIKTLPDLFYHELQLLWSTETALADELPKLIARTRKVTLKTMLDAQHCKIQ